MTADQFDALFALAELGSDEEDHEEMLSRVRGARKAVAERRRSDSPKRAGATRAVDAQNTHAPAPQLAEAKIDPDAQILRASASNFSDGHFPRDAQRYVAATEPNSVDDQATTETQTLCVVDGPLSTGSHDLSGTQDLDAPGGSSLRDPMLSLYVDVLDDFERVRIANENRVRQLTRSEADSDGEHRGFGLTEDHPDVARLIATVKLMHCGSRKYPEKLRGCCQEHDAIRNLEIAMKRHPLYSFVKRHNGIGAKQFARLLGAIGDPYWNDLHDRPRTVSELWAYCGLHVIKTSSSGQWLNDTQAEFAAAGTQPHTGGQDLFDTQALRAPGVAPTRRRGQKSTWSENARVRVMLIAAAMPKFPGGKYEQVYRQAREKYSTAIHLTECIRCGPSGKPAQPGSPLSDGHQHARAVRIVAKEILKDLWIEARGLYMPPDTVSGK